jgi:hypothetical protein
MIRGVREGVVDDERKERGYLEGRHPEGPVAKTVHVHLIAFLMSSFVMTGGVVMDWRIFSGKEWMTE